MLIYRYWGIPGENNIYLQEVLFMNIGVTEISPREVQRAAEKNFKGGYYCCEALMCTIRDAFKLVYQKKSLQCHPVWQSGAGKSGCVCGAFNGGLHCTWNVLRKNRTGWTNQSKEYQMYGTDT